MDLQVVFLFLQRFYLLIFTERGREGERERETSMCGCLWLTTPYWCPDWESNQQPFGSQARAQSTDLHQPGPVFLLLKEDKINLFKDSIIKTYKSSTRDSSINVSTTRLGPENIIHH